MKLPHFIAKLLTEGTQTAFILTLTLTSVAAQRLKVTETQKPKEAGFDWTYIIVLGLGIVLGCAIFWWLSRRRSDTQGDYPKFEPSASVGMSKPKPQNRLRPKSATQNQSAKSIPEPSAPSVAVKPSPAPVFSIKELAPIRSFVPLQLSSDESLLSAIEQAGEELEEDEDLRGLALNILAKFRSRNSVEAISEIALYDVSSNLRARAVSVLAEFDHPSVFETILLACADPGREVRAAAAKGLFHLTFDRADAWIRLARADDAGRVRQAARAAIAGDLVQRSIERLTHPKQEYAYEAFAIIALLVNAEETNELFAVLQSTDNEEIKNAIIHTLTVVREAKRQNQPEPIEK